MSDERGISVLRAGFGAEAVPYLAAWDLQREVHARRVADEIDDTLILLEHPPVFTAGRRSAPEERPTDGTPVIDVDRGGRITFHGPGQLVGYPILRLPEAMDVVGHVRRLEEALLRTCADLGLPQATRIHGRSGVWILGDEIERQDLGGLNLRLKTVGAPVDDDEEFDPRLAGPEYAPSNAGQRKADRKLAQIGVRVAKGVTMHGFSMNCDVDLAWFDKIIPCGIRNAGVTSLSAELGRDITVEEVAPLVAEHLDDVVSEAYGLVGAGKE
ncbi:lipoyl(octanoyl) transferase LipB [Catenulispora sp. NF23]|uniref:lipoyl(octanoyl) transferase LipB n=1 Tax=Catenulispora pinistramenti TaxID=2705254 RepID=UPI001BABF804|nr:lipoyl(octanoyl) transferase LipB [Catenulispora pinistramenti]MBS2533574.1 lipoyl(octanoyl) transferase LipB [Catenulispora pinistramenti]